MKDLVIEFWPVLVFVAAAVVSYVRNEGKSKKLLQESSRQSGDIPEDEWSDAESYDVPADFSRPFSNGEKRSGKTSGTRNKRVTVSSLADDKEYNGFSDDDRKIKTAVKNRSEAKKAIIYSEIFNKKYF